jgi:hypothetical protein
MASKILATFETGITATITGTSLADAAGRISTVIDNTSTRASMAMIFVRTKTGAAAPTAGTPIKLYLIRRSNMGTDLADNALGLTDAAVSVEPIQAELLGSIGVTASTATVYEKSFLAYDLSPKYSLVLWNAIGNALSGTAGDHIVQVIPITPEGQ